MLNADDERLDRLEKQYPGITDTIRRIDEAMRTPTRCRKTCRKGY